MFLKPIKYKRYNKLVLEKELQSFLDTLIVEGESIIFYHEERKDKKSILITVVTEKYNEVL